MLEIMFMNVRIFEEEQIILLGFSENKLNMNIFITLGVQILIYIYIYIWEFVSKNMDIESILDSQIEMLWLQLFL